MEASYEGGQSPEGAVAPIWMDVAMSVRVIEELKGSSNWRQRWSWAPSQIPMKYWHRAMSPIHSLHTAQDLHIGHKDFFWYQHSCTYVSWGHAVAQWLRHCATNQKVAESIPDGVTGIFHWHNPFGRIMSLGSTQPLTEMSTRNIFWG
jgi:hypothetical protein